MDNIFLLQKDLPVLADCDVLVTGSSYAGMAAALTLARAGLSVMIVDSHIYLGSDVFATLRPWLCVPHGDNLCDLAELIRTSIETSHSTAYQ